MSGLTMIARLPDKLILAEALDDGQNVDEYRVQAKQILGTITHRSQPKLTIDSGNSYFASLIQNDICYLTLCERSYPKKLAFGFLEELQKEFDIQYGNEVAAARRPYAFIKFDTFIQKTKKLYADTRSQRNLSKVTEDLTDITGVMNKNIAEILGRGEKIDDVSRKSSALLQSTSKYKKQAKDLNASMFFRKYGWIIVAVVIILLVFYWRFF
eukprot:TRINITY_DN22110_c0_g1_i1.p1 TRINITY_DN22110_c0_g1~~TRINITY_DN22110_c0_g1_i1.p1  ORF type:complete len:212 (+),score=43.43 TRINITY_DN22110_c0_g1_i1:88-723(+)